MSEANPQQSDAILGGQTPPPVTGAILGGLAGAKQRLKSETTAARRSALTEAMQYGEQGIDLAVQALQDPDEDLQRFASRILRTQGGEKGQEALLEHAPMSYFTTLESWRFEPYNAEVGIVDPESNACVIRMTNNGRSGRGFSIAERYDLSQFEALIQDPNVQNLQALVFQLDHNYSDAEYTFSIALDALLEAKTHFPNLKALFIGDSEGECPEFCKSKLRIFDIRPILENFPTLEVLQVYGFFGEYDGYTMTCEGLRHESLKSLIIETSDLTGENIQQLCSMDLPNLEYFELWFGRNYGYSQKALFSALNPILSGDIYPNIKYLGLCSSEDMRTLLPLVINAPITEQLIVLNMSMGTLNDSLIEPFTEIPETAKLKVLEVTGNNLSPEALSWLAQYAEQVISEYQLREDYYYDNEEEEEIDATERRINRHYALHE